MPLVARRKLTETWREAVANRGRGLGREGECLASFDAAVEKGAEEFEAASLALREWDGLWFVQGPDDPWRRPADPKEVT